MGAHCNKLLLPVAGRPVLAWTLDAAFAAESISWIGIVGQPADQSSIMNLAKNVAKPVIWIDGGTTRQESVQCGLAALPLEADQVLIHDGARCLVEPALLDRCSALVAEGDGVIAATPVTDTIKRVGSDGVITATPDRSELWAAQTPQCFVVAQLLKAHAEALARGWTVTDDASLYERLGWSVRVVDAGPANIKVTTPFDLTVAEAVLKLRSEG